MYEGMHLGVACADCMCPYCVCACLYVMLMSSLLQWLNLGLPILPGFNSHLAGPCCCHLNDFIPIAQVYLAIDEVLARLQDNIPNMSAHCASV